MTKQDALDHLREKLASIKENGPGDAQSWEYAGDVTHAIELIETGADVDDVLKNI